MSHLNYLAIDIGGGSGRGIVGHLDGDQLTLSEVHRFDNYYVNVNGRYYWDILHLLREMIECIRKSDLAFPGNPIKSFGLDMWGADFSFLDENGFPIGNAVCNRNTQGLGMRKYSEDVMPLDELFKRSGMPNRAGNTIFQLYERILEKDTAINNAAHFFMLPDLFGAIFTGKFFSEYTIAATSLLVDPYTKQWNTELIRSLNLPESLFPDIIKPGSFQLELIPQLFEGQRSDLRYVPVAAHDTASAIAAIGVDPDEAFCSSGTWSIIGTAVDSPVINDQVHQWNFANEVTADGRYRLQKDVMGMWLMQQFYRSWNSSSTIAWDDIVQAAKAAAPLRTFISIDEPEFYNDGDPLKKIETSCKKNNQPVPAGPGEIARCVYENMALRYCVTLRQAEKLSGRTFRCLRIVGGGSQNEFLNQMAADATNVPVYAGPIESSCIGNILLQAKAAGQVSDIKDFKHIAANSFPIKKYMPENHDVWKKPLEEYLRVIQESL
jgi:rhamnulokinase